MIEVTYADDSTDKETESNVIDILHEQYPVEIKVFVMTWNMGNSEAEGFDKVLQRGQDKVDIAASYDLFIIGLQESTYVEANNIDPAACYTSLASTIASILGPDYYEVSETNVMTFPLVLRQGHGFMVDIMSS